MRSAKLLLLLAFCTASPSNGLSPQEQCVKCVRDQLPTPTKSFENYCALKEDLLCLQENAKPSNSIALIVQNIHGQGCSTPQEAVAQALAEKLRSYPPTFWENDIKKDIKHSVSSLRLLFATSRGINTLQENFSKKYKKTVVGRMLIAEQEETIKRFLRERQKTLRMRLIRRLPIPVALLLTPFFSRATRGVLTGLSLLAQELYFKCDLTRTSARSKNIRRCASQGLPVSYHPAATLSELPKEERWKKLPTRKLMNAWREKSRIKTRGQKLDSPPPKLHSAFQEVEHASILTYLHTQRKNEFDEYFHNEGSERGYNYASFVLALPENFAQRIPLLRSWYQSALEKVECEHSKSYRNLSSAQSYWVGIDKGFTFIKASPLPKIQQMLRNDIKRGSLGLLLIVTWKLRASFKAGLGSVASKMLRRTA